MNFQQLRSVRETVRRGFNLTEVANALFTSQPGVSRQIRELEEETALRNPKFKWGKDFRETPKYARGKTARYYIAELKEGDVELRPNPFTGRLEHHEFAWFDYEEARELVSPRVKPIFEWAHDKITSEKV